jgi:hypothetical protein
MSGNPDPATSPELTALAEALRDLLPRASSVDRDAVFFRAGQAAAPRRWWWPVATAMSSAAAVTLGVLLALRPVPAEIERVVYVQVPSAQRPEQAQGAGAPRSPSESMETAGYPDAEAPTPVYHSPQRRLEEHLLRWGFDGLSVPAPDPNPPARAGDFLSHSFSSTGD